MRQRRSLAGRRGRAALLAMLLALAPLSAATAQAAPASPKDALFVSAAEMAAGAGKPLGSGPTYSYQTIVRDKEGEIEVHDNWNDILVVQDGRAEVLLGGTVTGGRVIAGGEHRGGSETGARSQPLAPGDVLFIPAGMPHLIKLAAGTRQFRYLAIKTQP